MVGFYAILWLTGSTIEDATRAGWVNESVESPSWIDKVVWSVLPSQALTLLAMISVVALSSSLDIAAIEIELKRPLDYNHELRTVGWSNVISGLLGGYTGSYSEFLRRVRSLHGLTELSAAYSILADDLLPENGNPIETDGVHLGIDGDNHGGRSVQHPCLHTQLLLRKSPRHDMRGPPVRVAD
ncbi:hypothetical protein THAOC_06941 [Thalassiosira oceanica]|uniref:SLC26A/SulP transporter domain-containing protein n=1 Tax=Thalassiosira oceanica TaxID=159749 RepID=K0SYX3_THAOC|nr:hypothetical protein THAOC_06941 [Thalassiosira oceanica]|eukprot:EJK71598.1 hypothetical protein THAOC_06941 [Thalassiosira oceanica]